MGKKNADFTVDEIVSMGLPGLVKAIEAYDPSRGATFGTWAEWTIKGPLWRAIVRERRSRLSHASEPDDCAAPDSNDQEDLSEVLNKVRHLLNVPQQIYVSLVQRGLNQKAIAKVLSVSEVRVGQMKREIVSLLRPHCCEED